MSQTDRGTGARSPRSRAPKLAPSARPPRTAAADKTMEPAASPDAAARQAESDSGPTDGDAQAVPRTPDDLHLWIRTRLEVDVLRAPLVPGHAAPFDYVVHAFFEGTVGRFAGRSPDCVVWANRGGGKTFLAALVTLLDLIFKPGVQVRLLGGSLDQSRRMQEHLHRFAGMPGAKAACAFTITRDRVETCSGSAAEVLSASQTSVRGTRVQKVRCDEVDLFDPELWEAVQLTTRSMPQPGPWGDVVKGSIDALSTMHRPFGLMWSLAGMHAAGEQAPGAPKPEDGPELPRRPIFRWGVLDALERCTDRRACAPCALLPECAERAKLPRVLPDGQSTELAPGAYGHITIDDAVRMKSRVGRATWEAEMLCLRPRRDDSVYPEFDPARHVVRDTDFDGPEPRLRPLVKLVGGMDFGFRAEGVVLLAGVTQDQRVIVLHEHCREALKLADHVEAMTRWLDPRAAGFAGLERGTPPAWIAIDPAGNSTDAQTGESNAAVLRKAGFTVRSKGGTIDSGVRAVRDLLDPAFEPGGVDGQARPKLYIHERCTRLIECMHRYRYPEHDKQTLIPVKTDGVDHACDALRYMIVNLLRRGKTGWLMY